MKHRILTILLSLLIVIGTVVSVNAATLPVAPVGDKVVFKDADWAYEKVNTYGWEIDEYIGDSTEPSIPWSFAKEYVTSVGSYAFSSNTGITSVTTTGVLETVGEYAFNGCTALSRIELYESLTTLGVGCFYGCSSLTDINLEDTLITSVPAYCFADCGISELALPDSCTKIGNMAFYNCSALTKITIPQSVTEIHQDAFKGSENVVIYCYTDSYAHQYAEDNGIEYVLIDAPDEDTYILGDTDGNDYVDVVDATWVQRYAALMDVTPVSSTLMNGDVDGDGDPSVVDATFIMRYAVDIQTPYAIGEPVSRV